MKVSPDWIVALQEDGEEGGDRDAEIVMFGAVVAFVLVKTFLEISTK